MIAGEAFLGRTGHAAPPQRRVLVWSEGTAPKKVYPKDINGAIADGLKPLEGWEIVTASLADPEQGVSDESLGKADVLIWWGHKYHRKIEDAHVARIVRRVKQEGMGFIALHSAHYSKPLKKLLGTPCGWKGGYVEDGSAVRLIVKDQQHPIARGVADFTLPHTERYSEPFEAPQPESVVLDGIYTRPDGTKEAARQGLVWTIGQGKVFYFQPGHETYPIFFDENVRKIMRNAVQWAAGKK
jgi:trehalose utilization protein